MESCIFFTIKHRVAAFKAFYAIRSFITFKGIFMADGYDLGKNSVWRRKVRKNEWQIIVLRSCLVLRIFSSNNNEINCCCNKW